MTGDSHPFAPPYTPPVKEIDGTFPIRFYFWLKESDSTVFFREMFVYSVPRVGEYIIFDPDSSLGSKSRKVVKVCHSHYIPEKEGDPVFTLNRIGVFLEESGEFT